jgi:acylphosphatase
LIVRICRVTGRVQGVFYRASARARAESLGVVGYARNLADGSVEVLACGESAAVDAFCQWLWQGSPASQVTGVTTEERAPATVIPWPASFKTS